MKKKVEDLVYPDVIEITSKEQMDKIKKYCKNIYDFNGFTFYLFGRKNSRTGNGQSKTSYSAEYNNYKFEDIIFPDKEQQFIVGQWYKRDTGTYVKFKELENNVFVSSEDIAIFNKSLKIREESYGDITNPSNTYTLLTDLTEIQQYLPFNHPDKIKEQPKQKENLIGRYFKRLYNDYSNEIKIGTYLKVVDQNDTYYILEKYGQIYKDTELFELMPIGFTPPNESKQETFKPKDLSTLKDCYIELNNEDEYNALTLFLNNNGFKLYLQYDWKYEKDKRPIGTVYLIICKSGEYFTNDSTDNKKQILFNNLSEYGFKYVKPLEAKVHESIPEYVKLLTNFDDQYTGKIFKTSLNPPWSYTQHKYNSVWEWLIKDVHSKYFIPATEAEFLLQETTQKLSEKCVNTFGSYVTSGDPYMNDVIEVGDEVEVINNCSYNHTGKGIGYKFIVKEINKQDNYLFYRPIYGKTTGIISTSTKLTKKANHQTTPVNSKRVDCISPQVNTNLSSLIKIRNSKPLQKLEKRTRLIIQKTKTIKLNQNG